MNRPERIWAGYDPSSTCWVEEDLGDGFDEYILASIHEQRVAELAEVIDGLSDQLRKCNADATRMRDDIRELMARCTQKDLQKIEMTKRCDVLQVENADLKDKIAKFIYDEKVGPND